MFNPAALRAMDASLDDGEVISGSDDELRRIAGPDIRRKITGIKLAARIVGMASAGRDGSPDEGALFRSMESAVERLKMMRRTVLEAVGVDSGSPDYQATFNAATNVVMDMLTEEWKWSRMTSAPAKPMPISVMGSVLKMAATNGPVYIENADEGDVQTARRLCVMESLPKLWVVVNMFDYYQTDREAMVSRLAGAVSREAESNARILYGDSPSFGVRAIVQRMYGVSTGLMCEVYKEVAARDVERLRAMPAMDRAVTLVDVEKYGLRYDHIIERHKTLMVRMLDTTRLVLEAQQEPTRNPEHQHDQ